MNGWTFRNASEGDWPEISSLLSASGLPLAGARAHLDAFLLAFLEVLEGRLVGTAAFERYGDTALRSRRR